MSKSFKTKEAAKESIKVVVRCRPIAQSEVNKGFRSVVEVVPDNSSINIKRPKTEGGTDDDQGRVFTFDYVYPPDVHQKKLFQETAYPIIQSVLEGYNGTIFAYGQTGTGKTYTMEGSLKDSAHMGIMPNTFNHIFETINSSDSNVQFLVKASFLEVYLDDVYDLLATDVQRKKMELKKDPTIGIYVKDLQTETAQNPQDLFRILATGQAQRKVGETEMNKGSSRSHSIFSIVIDSAHTQSNGEVSYRSGKLNLVDLAGSERQKKTKSEGDRMDEAKFINLSLSALGNVIKALASNATHVPFRDSKLTRLLEDSLGGNTKTVMIANIGPADYNWSETMSTLRYADRAKKIKNKPTINEDPKDTELREMQEEIKILRAKLLAKQQGLDINSLDHAALMKIAQGGIHSLKKSREPKVKIVDTGYRMEDLQQIIDDARREEKEMTDKSEAEKVEILARKAAAEAEYKQLQAELLANQEKLKNEAMYVKKMQDDLKKREEMLLTGGGEIQKAMENRRILLKFEEELKRKRAEQNMLELEIVEREDQRLLMDEQYQSVEAELLDVQRKMKELYGLYKEKKDDMRVLIEEFDIQRTDKLEQIRAIDKQIKLRSLVIESYMPFSFYQIIDNIKKWDPINEEWLLPGLPFSGNAVYHRKLQSIQDEHQKGLMDLMNEQEKLDYLENKDLVEHNNQLAIATTINDPRYLQYLEGSFETGDAFLYVDEEAENTLPR